MPRATPSPSAHRPPLTPLQVSALAVHAERPRHPDGVFHVFHVLQVLHSRRERHVVRLRPGSFHHAPRAPVTSPTTPPTGRAAPPSAETAGAHRAGG